MFQRFGTEKDESIALRCYAGMENRRAWDALSFPVHPCHDHDRDRVQATLWFAVYVPTAHTTYTTYYKVVGLGVES